MDVKFKECPDCGHEGVVFERNYFVTNTGRRASKVAAICELCHLRTRPHNNVRECAEEWNALPREEDKEQE